MKFDTWFLTHSLLEMATLTQAAEAIGFQGLWTAETDSNGFLPLVLASEHSRYIQLGTSIAPAFPRTPTVLAHIAWDLQRYSHGRFTLGLGAQVKAHNERRLGVKWEKPVHRMRETVEAIRAIWACWQHGTPLNYQGEFFRLRLMTPFFSGKPLDVSAPPIYISAINRHMLQLAGQVCDGVLLHPFHTVRYLREFAWEQLSTGLKKGGRKRSDFTAVGSVFAIPTDGGKAASEYERFAREQISFYMSTPAYRVVVALHGWEETAQHLSKLARAGNWGEMPSVLTDEMLEAFAISGKWRELPGIVKSRYGDTLLDRISFYLPFIPGEEDDGWRAAVAGFNAYNSIPS